MNWVRFADFNFCPAVLLPIAASPVD